MANIKSMMLGGGAKYFGKENKNLAKIQKDSYDIVSNKDELNQSQSKQVLGTFSEKICHYK